MAEKTDLNVSPYYDDYSEDKNFHKVLYRAGRALQSRELIQSQSILQNQIERFGGHMFKEGSIVQGAQTDVNMELYYVKVNSANPNALGDTNVETYRQSFHGKFLKGKTTGVVAKVITSSAETTDDSLTLFVKYQSQGTDTSNSFTFSSAEELQEVTVDGDGVVALNTTNYNEFTVGTETTINSVNGLASIANISEGVIFIRGFFIKVPAQELILEKYSGTPSYRVGLTIVESSVDSATDSSLNDNATGTTNENAPGADRLSIALTLSKYALTTTDDSDFVETMRVNNGIIELEVNRPMYNEIENTLARRTFDANGDFVVNQFTHSLREHLDDSTNRGFYASAQGGDESQFVMQVSPGKAYVKGYEIDKVGTTTIPFSKARTTVSLDNANTPIRLGNKLKVKNIHSLPEFGNEAGDDAMSPFAPCELWNTSISSAGTKPTTFQIGTARVRNIDLDTGSDSSDVYTNASVFNLYMFDIKMFTRISGTLSGTFTTGDRVVSNSGAVAIVSHTDGAELFVHDVVGTFAIGNSITTEGVTSGTTTVTAVRSYNVDRARSITQTAKNTNREIFTADLVADSDKTLTGSLTMASGSTAVTGFGTKYLTELKEGDIIVDQAGNENVVASVTNDLSLTLTGNGTTTFSGNATRRRVRIFDQDQTAAISSWPRDWISTHTAESIQVRRQEVITVASNEVQLSTGSNGVFGAKNTDNFTIAVIEAATGYAQGDLLNVEDFGGSPQSSGSGQTLTLTGFDSADNGAVLRVTSTITITDPVNRDKTIRPARLLKVGSARSAGGKYGTAYDDREISLGVADTFKIRGIYEGVGGTTPLPPSATFTVSSGTFVNYEKFIGQTSNAHGIIITTGGTTYFYYVSGTFVDAETVVGQTSKAVATLSNVSQGSSNITSRYFFDNGQRDGFYDLGKLTLKTGSAKPSNPILICFDYFTPSGSGDFFDVESYASIDYRDIPVYSPNKVDLGGLEPDGTFELSDSLDFRPVCGQILGTSTFGSNNAQDPTSPVNLSTDAQFAPFGYTTGRNFEGSRTGISSTGANATDTPVTGSSFVGDISFFVGRYDKVFLHKSGSFQTSVGTPSLTPAKPKGVDESIELFELYVPPYTLNLSNIRVRSQDHRRFTMKDVARINNRVTNLERITSLSLLEKDTQTKQILDADGLDRFKSGFLVDNFRGHRVGDVNHPDYNIAIDTKLGAMRPKSYQQFFDISLNTATSSSYTKTGDLITLPFSESSFVNQDKASRTINVNPYNVFAFIGNIKLTPGTDVWQDTDQLPEVRINREGNFDAIQALNNNALGTVWNSWQTTWVGEPTQVSSEVESTSNGSWNGDPTQGGEWIAGQQVTREITETVETQTRTGVTTSVVEDFVETRNDRVVSVTLIPFMRARTIEIDADNLKPNTNHYVFFDNMRVDEYTRPFSATYSQDGGTTATSFLKTDGNGRLRAYFDLPNTDRQRFPTGMREVKITSSFYNLSNPPSSGTEIYQAQGLLQSSQTEVVSTRNARVITGSTTGERTITRRGEMLNTEVFDATAPIIPIDIVPPIIIDPPIVSPILPPVSLPPLPIEPPLPPFIGIGRRRRFEDFEMRFDMEDMEPRWRDPLAQSFMVESNGGMFVSSIDVFFETKDATLPVSVEIRNMVNGYPGQLVMPFSIATKTPSQVNTSTDGSVATTFTFDSPVYLKQNQEMCFVVYSNSNEYNVFISRMGETDLATGQTIAGQPYAGSLFMSQNASTWTAEQTDDLKFNLKKCRFDITKTPLLKFDNDTLPVHTLQNNPIETFSGQNYVRVINYFHGMYSTSSNTTVAGVVGDKSGAVLTIGTPVVSGTPVNGTYTNVATTTTGSGVDCTVDVVVTDNAISSCVISGTGSNYTTSDSLTITNFDGGTADATIAIDSIGETLGGIPVDSINSTFTAIANISIDSFTVIPDLSAFDLKAGYTADNNTLGGGSVATSSRDYYFDSLHTMIPSTQVEGTRIVSSVNLTPATSPEAYINGTAYTKRLDNDFITLNDNAFLGFPSMVASSINETNEMSGGKSFTTVLQMQSFNNNISPVVDVSTIGVIAIGNRLNQINSSSDLAIASDYVSSTESDADNNAMIYCTRKVNLKTPASSVKVIADFFRPPTTDLKVMYKVLSNDDSTPFDELDWIYFNTDGSPDITTERDARNFKEYEFTADNLPEFSAFAVKIVGQGTNTSVVPLVSALRCLALA